MRGIIRFSANIGFLWADRPLLGRIDAAAAAGFKAVEVQWPYDVPAEDFGAACRRHQLTPLVVNTQVNFAAGERGLGALPGRERDFAALMDRALAYCATAGFTMINSMAGLVPEAQRAAGREVLIRNLLAASDKAAKQNVTLVVEALNRRDVPGYFYWRVEDAAAVVEAVNRPNVRLMFDIYHAAIEGGDILTRLRRYLPLAAHVQIAGVPDRTEPDEGEIAYPAIFGFLEDAGYTGWIGAEYKPRGETDAGLGWMRTLVKPG
jgi:hydroxypyruvate isomerase